MFIALELFWIILNGKLTVEIAIIGLILSGIIYAFVCIFMNYSIQKDIALLRMLPLYLHYMAYLLFEILISNVKTIKMLTTSKYEIEPAVVLFEVDLKSTLNRVLLANSITLTPGTITLSLEGPFITVHAIDKDFLDGIEESKFIQLLRRIEATGI